tara:strand:+ start:127 stop:531 length:405 start_codon:yes stop_codon:yes gene_type:complete
MRVSDIILEAEPNQSASKLVQILRTVINSADQANQSVYLHFEKPSKEAIRKGSKNLDLNKLMQNVGGEQFDYSTFKAAYDTDARVKTMISNFNEKGIEPKTAQAVSKGDTPQQDAGGDAVSQMAKSATDLGDKI